MRVLEVSSFMPPHPGGLELVVANLVGGLQERSHEVRWLASATPLARGTDGPLIRVRAFSRFEDWFSVPLPLWGPDAIAELIRQCRWADVVHVHDCLYPSSALAIATAKAHKKPVLMTQHIAEVPYRSAFKNGLQRVAYATLGSALLQSVDKVVTYSQHVRDYFRNMGVSKLFELIPLGFDARFRAPTIQERTEWRRSYGISLDAKVVLFAARLVGKKGVSTVAEIQRTLGQEGFTLLVAGDGPERHELARLLRLLHLPAVPYADMHKLYGLADVLLLPSRGEGLPLTVQEAMLTGLPVVVSTDPSYRANLESAPGVSLCSDVPAMLSAVRRALARPLDRAAIAGWAGNVWGRARFIDGYERILHELSTSSYSGEECSSKSRSRANRGAGIDRY